ncbi:MAG: beta-N-acetylhexosaminidase [Mariprofundaceae bacterium]|nr:beta-N-acetylhexosaminidase [Mariprofundaceae bacterium]
MNEHLVIGLKGTVLTSEERTWLSEKPPAGVILFARNIESPEQVKALLASVRECGGDDIAAAIDEEGGRINRLPWPPFNNRTQADEYGRLYERAPESAVSDLYNDAYEAGTALRELGFTHNCAPVLDLFNSDGDAIIGNRAYGPAIHTVASLGVACIHGLQDAGIEAIGKHFPGHGRANADSHVAVPVVDAPVDVLLQEAESFTLAFSQNLNHVMTAHVTYPAADEKVATLSHYWIHDVLREQMGFAGTVWSDDLCMKGVGSNVHEAADAALKAGCELLLVCEPEGVEKFYEE